MRLTETVDDPKREPVSELVPGHPQTRLFLFCFGVFFLYFLTQKQITHAF